MNYYLVLFSNSTNTWNRVGGKADIYEMINAEETILKGAIVDNVSVNMSAEQVSRFAIINCTETEIDDKVKSIQNITNNKDMVENVEWIVDIFEYNNILSNDNEHIINGEGLHQCRSCFNTNLLKFNVNKKDDDVFAEKISFSFN